MVGHWDDATAEVIDRGPLQGTRQRLAPVAGCVRLRLSRYRLGSAAWGCSGTPTTCSTTKCFYPRSQMVGLRGLGAYFRVETVDYWAAEGAF